MESTLEILSRAAAENWMMTLVFTSIVCCSLFSAVKSMVKSVQREKTRREIAAYIAEGSLTPEHGERLMQAGKSSHDAC